MKRILLKSKQVYQEFIVQYFDFSGLKRDPALVRGMYCFLFFFLVIFSYYIAKPIRNSLFLEWLGPAQLPLMYILSAIVSLGGAVLFEWLIKHTFPRILVSFIITLFAGMLIFFRIGFTVNAVWSTVFSVILFVFISFYAVASVTLFWSIVNDSFTEEEGRHWYGFIGIGGITGGMCGGTATHYLAPLFGTENLLILSAGILLLTLPFPYLITRHFHKTNCDEVEAHISHFQHQVSFLKGLKHIFSEPYIFCLASIVFFTTLSATLFDFQYQTIIKEANLSKDLRTALFGQIFFWINLIGIIIHLFFTKPILKKWGPIVGIMIVPIVSIPSVLFLGVSSKIMAVMLCWTALGGLTYSLLQVSKETLYIRLPRGVKYSTKAYIDTFIWRGGDAAASLIIMLNIWLFHFETVVLLAYNAIIAVGWLFVGYLLYKRYLVNGENLNP